MSSSKFIKLRNRLHRHRALVKMKHLLLKKSRKKLRKKQQKMYRSSKKQLQQNPSQKKRSKKLSLRKLQLRKLPKFLAHLLNLNQKNSQSLKPTTNQCKKSLKKLLKKSQRKPKKLLFRIHLQRIQVQGIDFRSISDESLLKKLSKMIFGCPDGLDRSFD